MLFVSITFYLSIQVPQERWDIIIYVDLIGFIITSLYLVCGYLSKRKYYKELVELINSDNIADLKLPGKVVSQEQRLYHNLYKKLQRSNNRNIKRLQDEKKEYQDFILSWVHEIKLPIATGKLILTDAEHKTGEYLADKLEDELLKINYYVEQVLYYSRVDNFARDYFLEEVELKKLTNECIKKYVKLFIGKHIRVFDLKELYSVYSDSKWLSYIIDQILYNSLKYTASGGSIRIYYEEDEQEKQLRIEDTGIGISKQDIGRVFEKGFTGSVGRNYYKSTGMGLYLSKRMANKLGHEITIESEEGQYTRVIIHFPKVSNYLYME
jgi:signal transduction histidine kinase